MKIVFYAGPAFERWTPESAERDGAGGAELFLARAAKELARRGHDVTVFADTPAAADYAGVTWVPYEYWTSLDRGGDLLIVWRRPEALDRDLSRFDRVWFMAQDNHYGDALRDEARTDKIDRYMVVSPWHLSLTLDMYPFLIGKEMLTRNGIDLSYAKAAEGLSKVPGRVLWTSSPDRGLEALLDVWPVIRDARPYEAMGGLPELHVCYGFKTLRARAESRGDAALLDLIGRCERKLGQPGIVVYGRLGQKEMAEAYARAAVWVGPHAWDEAYCQAAAEAQVAGCRIVAPARAALATTIETPRIWTGDLAADVVRAIDQGPARAPEFHVRAESKFGVRPVIDQWEIEMRGGVDQIMADVRGEKARAPARPTIGLCMIVRNESARIRRCLDSIKPFLDWWTIVDTGSTDGTQDMVREIMGPAGMLYERLWVNWHTNMTEAFELARPHTDFVWVIDADEEVSANIDRVDLSANVDAYTLAHKYRGGGGDTFERKRILSTKRDWVQKGIGPMQIHEYPVTKDGRGPHVSMRLEGVTIINHNDGNQGSLTDEQRRARYKREAENCEEALAADPNDYRAAFYRGQSWRDAGNVDAAINAYEWRASMVGGWDEERFVAALEAAKLRGRRGDAPERVKAAYLYAWGLRPWRAEPLCYLAGYMRERRNYREALAYAEAADGTLGARGAKPPKGETLFVDSSVYAWRIGDELCIARYWTGDYDGALSLAEALIEHGPADQRARFESNAEHARRALAEGRK